MEVLSSPKEKCQAYVTAYLIKALEKIMFGKPLILL